MRMRMQTRVTRLMDAAENSRRDLGGLRSGFHGEDKSLIFVSSNER